MENLKIVIIGEKKYLCNFDEVLLSLNNAYEFKNEITSNIIEVYLKNKNIDKLKSISLSKTQIYSVYNLDDSQISLFELYEKYFNEAKKDCIKYLENTIFEKLLKDK